MKKSLLFRILLYSVLNIAVLVALSSCMVNPELRPARYADESVVEDTGPLVIDAQELDPPSKELKQAPNVRELRNENYILESAVCDSRGELDFVLKNVGGRVVPLEGGDPPVDQGKAIRLLVNGFPISNLQEYCKDVDLSPGSKAFCVFQPKGSKDRYIKIEQPPKINILQVKQADYSASMQLQCGSTKENYAIREIRCTRSPDSVFFTLGGIFDTPVSLDDFPDALQVTVNGFKLSHLRDYCKRTIANPGDDIDCVRTEHSPYDRGVKLFTGNAAQNSMSIRYGAYTQSVSFGCI